MSSFVVGTDLIDLLATAARRIRNGKMPDRFFDYEDTATAQSIGEALAHFNNVGSPTTTRKRMPSRSTRSPRSRRS